jgi:hypothetical protein
MVMFCPKEHPGRKHGTHILTKEYTMLLRKMSSKYCVKIMAVG